MTKDEAYRIVVDAINEIQELSGREIIDITDRMRPIGDLQGFDSANGLELTMSLAEKSDVEIPLDENILVSEDGSRALTVGEVATRLLKFVNQSEK